jgi:hypothetical protein
MGAEEVVGQTMKLWICARPGYALSGGVSARRPGEEGQRGGAGGAAALAGPRLPERGGTVSCCGQSRLAKGVI